VLSVPVAAAVLAALAAALAVAPGPLSSRRPVAREGRAGPVLLLVAVAGACVVAVLLLEGTSLALGFIGLGAAGGVARLHLAGRRRREAQDRRTRVVELGEALVGELRAGRPVLAMLARGAEVWPPFRSVEVAAAVGADVSDALHRLGRLPGAEGLHDLAAAWRVSERSGAGLSAALAEVVESARARHAADHLVRAELASAQATARLVAVLPLATLGLSTGTGGDPWGFLLGHPAGLACLATGTGLVLAGLAWIDRIADAVVRT
jgi:tight adherence protein B